MWEVTVYQSNHQHAIQEVARSVDLLAAKVAAIAAYVAHLPSADKVNIGSSTACAHELAPSGIDRVHARVLSHEVARTVEQIAKLASSLHQREAAH
jgi:hypothetical protein